MDPAKKESKTDKTDFKTPEEAAAEDDLTENPNLPEPETASDQGTKTPAGDSDWHRLRNKLNLNWPFGQREWAIVAAAIVILAAGICFLLLHLGNNAVSSNLRKITHTKAKTVASNLTGLQVDPKVNQRPVTGVMIENSIFARPQSGLSDAGVVFEAIAEGGITRFLALYQDKTPANVGPIRSARPYYVQWALGFNAGYAHVGGSPEALAKIRAWHARDLDEFANAGAYHRISSREAPHNVYTGINTLIKLEASKGYKTSNYNGFARKRVYNAYGQKIKPPPTTTAQPAAKRAGRIDFSTSGPLYNAHYDYDPAQHCYKRSEGGAPQGDANNSRRICPTVVIGLVMHYSLESDGYHSDYWAISHGPAYIFQDGTVTIGKWTKKSIYSQITFSDNSGKPILLEPGQTWLTALSDTGKINYKP